MSSLSKILIGVIIGMFIILGGLVAYNQDLRKSNNNWKHNYEVLQDSVEVIQTKYGETLYENGSLIIEKKELEDALDISKKQIKDYEKKLNSDLAYIAKLEAQLSVKDTIKVTEVVYEPLSNSYTMHYNDNWLSFGEIFSLKNPEKPTLNVFDIKMNVPLKVGITDDYHIFVTSPNPYFNVSSIEGAVIDGSQFAPKKQRWVFGIYMGIGGQYGLINKQLDFGPQVGAGVGFVF
jgi:hypothetical protein